MFVDSWWLVFECGQLVVLCYAVLCGVVWFCFAPLQAPFGLAQRDDCWWIDDDDAIYKQAKLTASFVSNVLASVVLVSCGYCLSCQLVLPVCW